MKYKVSVYPESFKGKDKSVMKESTKKITKLIPKFSRKLSVAELAAAIDNMRVFCPATFKGDHKSQDELEAIQFFALDFDGGIDIDTAKDRTEYYKLPIAIYYETSSSVNWSKFRLVFLCCQEVNDKDLAVLVQYCLCTVFPEVDKSSKDFSKLYYPGKNVFYSDVSFSIHDLLISTLAYLQKNDPKNKMHILKRIAKKSHVVLRNNTFAFIPNSVSLSSGASLLPPPAEESESPAEEMTESYDFRAITIYNNMVDAQKSSESGSLFFYESCEDYTKVYRDTERKCRRDPERTDISGDTYCRLLNEFRNGRRLPHEEWFGLSLNLIHIKGGKALITETFCKYSSLYDDIERKEVQIDFACRNDYIAQRCDDYCPYAQECDHESNMVYTLKMSSGKIIELDNEPVYKDTEVMRRELREEIEKSMELPGVKIIKAPTGAGKTYAYLSMVRESERQTIVAVPNKMLMYAVAAEAKDRGISYIATPLIDDLLKDLKKENAWVIRQLYTAGIETNTNYFIRDCGEHAAKEYLARLDDIRKFKGQLIITTHARLLNMKSDYLQSRNVIIDEDILTTMIQIRQVSIREIRDILHLPSREKPMPEDVTAQLERIVRIKGFEVIEGLSRNLDVEDTLSITKRLSLRNTSAVFPALRARCFYHKDGDDEVYFVETQPIPICNCTIVSATVNEMLYRRVLGDQLYSFKDLGELKYKGKLYLHHDRSYSKSCLTENRDIITELRKKYENKSNIITFKDFAKYGELYFGAAQGTNELAGCDLTVIGTFHRPEYVYKLWAMMMGDFNTDDTLAVRRIERNGFNFSFMTFKDTLLREIQLYLIESEAEQAAGRARLVSHDCNVHLFSNLPLKQCRLKMRTFGD
jgi:hypothetical protein